MAVQRKITVFERILLVAGFFLGGLGFHIINKVFVSTGRVLSFDMVISVLLWMILMFLIVIAATSENQKEEALVIASELHDETKLVKDFIKEQISEMKELREDLAKASKKKK